jgi:DNA-binding winged helix-turn-helix (wHTH) protein
LRALDRAGFFPFDLTLSSFKDNGPPSWELARASVAEETMNKGVERARWAYGPSVTPAARGDAPVRAVVAAPKLLEGRQWLALGEGGVDLEEPLTGADVRSLLGGAAAGGDAAPVPAVACVSVLFLAAKTDTEGDLLPVLVERIRDALASRPIASGRVLEIGALRIDLDAHSASVCGTPVPLTALEFRLLSTLVERRDRVQSRAALLSDVWECRSGVQTRTVDTHIKRLRDKLGNAGPAIETVRRVGYRFSARRAAATRPTPSNDVEGGRADRDR